MLSEPPIRAWLLSEPTIPSAIEGPYYLRSKVEWKLKELDQYIEAIHNLSFMANNEFNNDPPFDTKIMQVLLPRHFKIPQLESYDGTTDLANHLVSFWATMLLHGVLDHILCRAFPSTLKGVARY